MKKYALYTVLTMLAKFGIYGVLLAVTFMNSKALGFVAVGLFVLGTVVSVLKEAEKARLEEEAVSNLLQQVARQTGQGNC